MAIIAITVNSNCIGPRWADFIRAKTFRTRNVRPTRQRRV